MADSNANHIYATDAEIIMLFSQLIKSYQDKNEEDFLLDKAKNSMFNHKLYYSLLDLTQLLITYSK